MTATTQALAEDLATVRVLWTRDLLRFLRQRSRIAGALVQPLLFWLIIGGGMASSFDMRQGGGLDYMEYFFPGILVMMVLFASIFGTITVIEDRHSGFLQSVLTGPGSRVAVVTGKCLGVGSVGVLQALLFMALAPWAGFALGQIAWAQLLGVLVLAGLGLSAFGFALAWWCDSSQIYHALMSTVLLPAWVLSGAMFPIADRPVLGALMRGNPMSYLVSAVRQALYSGQAPAGTTIGGAATDVGVLLGFTLISVIAAAWLCSARR